MWQTILHAEDYPKLIINIIGYFNMGSLQLSFIILSWNSEKFLENCLKSIYNKCDGEGISFDAFIVDNGSIDDSCTIVEKFQAEYSGKFVLIALPGNKGTTYPRNLALKKARGEFVCIIDSDTELGDGNLSELLQKLSYEKKIGIIAPCLLLPDGSIQNSVKRFPTMLNKLMKLPRILLGIKTQNSDFYPDFPFNEEHTVDTAISACWFFRRDLLDIVGFLDEKIFYAPEDIDFSLRVWENGYSILYSPSFTVLHHTQQITHKKPLSKTSLSHFFGLVYYYRKHGGWLVRPRVTGGKYEY
jgi:GT2 family glycosyltransferase